MGLGAEPERRTTPAPYCQCECLVTPGLLSESESNLLPLGCRAIFASSTGGMSGMRPLSSFLKIKSFVVLARSRHFLNVHTRDSSSLFPITNSIRSEPVGNLCLGI